MGSTDIRRLPETNPGISTVISGSSRKVGQVSIPISKSNVTNMGECQDAKRKPAYERQLRNNFERIFEDEAAAPRVNPVSSKLHMFKTPSRPGPSRRSSRSDLGDFCIVMSK